MSISRIVHNYLHIGLFINEPGLANSRIIGGFHRYARNRPDWRLYEIPTLAALGPSGLRAARFAPDALLTNQVEVLQAFRHPNGHLPPYVLLDSIRPRFPTSDGISLNVDNIAIGRLAAERFASLGYRHFAYLGLTFSASSTPDCADFLLRYSALRRASFERAVSDFGESTHLFTPRPRTGSIDRSDELVAWIKSLPRPCGILAFSDEDASYAISIARELKIAVPRELGVLGIDNEEYVCENTVPSLSSVAPDYEEAGYRAATWIDDMLCNRPAPRGTRQLYGISQIVMRQSIASIRGTENRVLRANKMMRETSDAPVTPSRIAMQMGISRRTLERAFHASFGHGIYAEMLDRRLKRACTLLTTTQRPIGEIASECGFSSYTAFAATFRRHFGSSPGEWRKRK